MEKHIIQKVSHLLPSSLSSCHCHFKNVHPDIVHSSINLLSKTSQKFHSGRHKSKPKRHKIPTKLSSSSNNSGWFSTDEEQEGEEINKKVIIDHPETETLCSLSSNSFSSSSDVFLNSITARKNGDVRGKSFNSVMGNSPAIVSGEFKNVPVTSSRRMSSVSSSNLYFTDLGSFRREIIESRRRSDDNAMGHRRKSIIKSHEAPESEQSSEVSSTSSTNVKTTGRKTNRKNSKSGKTSTMKLFNDDEGSSSIKSTHLYYSDLGSFRRETANTRRKTKKKCWGKKWKVEESYAVVKSSSDPYSDFKLSMVEMIVEKEIYGEEELKKLLERFLGLNSSYHHDIILKVFLDVRNILFTGY